MQIPKLASTIAQQLHLDKETVEERLNAMTCLGMDLVVQIIIGGLVKLVNDSEEILKSKLEKQEMEEKKCIKADNYVENQYNMFCMVQNGTTCQHKSEEISVLQPLDADCCNTKEIADSEDNTPKVLSAISVLTKLISMQEGKGPKAQLMPYKAAIEAGIPLPVMNNEDFNARFGTKIAKTCFSNWINGTQDRYYTNEELEPYINIFKALK